MPDETSIIENAPQYQEWLATEKDLAARRDRIAQQMLAEQTEQQRIIDRHRAEMAKAADDGKPIPPSPVLPDLDRFSHPLTALRLAQDEHTRRRTAVLAEIARSGGVDACSARLRSTQEEAADAVRQVDDARRGATATLRELAALYAALDEVEGSNVRPRRADRIRNGLTVEEFAASVLEDVDLAELDGKVLGLSHRGPGGQIVISREDLDERRATPIPGRRRSPREHNERMRQHLKTTLGVQFDPPRPRYFGEF